MTKSDARQDARRPIVYYGAGSQAVVLHEFLSREFRPIALLDDATRDGPDVEAAPIICGTSAIEAFLGGLADPPSVSFAISIGNEYGAARLAKHQLLSSIGMSPVAAVHPSAYVARDAWLGPGVQILAGAVVGARARLGTQVIVNTMASVDHECVVADGVHIGPGARLAGRVKIGACAFIGMGALVLPDVGVGDHAILGAGAVAVADVPPRCVAIGMPARAITTLE